MKKDFRIKNSPDSIKKGYTLMKKVLFFAVITIFSVSNFAQQPTPTPTRPRVIVTQFPTPTPTPSSGIIIVTNSPRPTPTPTPRPTYTPIPSSSPNPSYTPNPTYTPIPFATPTPRPTPFPNAYKTVSYGLLKQKIAQAKSMMVTRPIPTAMTETFLATDIIRIAFYDWKTKEIDFVVMSKPNFLSRNGEFSFVSTNGKSVFVRIIRANGVNTPIIIMDENNQPHTPLIVQYPIERNGSLQEMAYYTSTHPGIGTPEVVNAGKLYVRNTIDIARQKLKEKGIFIQPVVADMAEKLCTVEHVDHARFRNEYHLNVFNDIFTLFALNEGNTYRYSVSRAGAGGMVQMIPSTYYMVRSKYYAVGLIPDFVEGMRNHGNAAQAMLLYMQWTWDDLISRETIYNAIENGVATPAELMSAGYNSNPAKLPGYIKRGGNNWRNLIPRETQIYLQINASMDRFAPILPRQQ
jgi:hypothetical protein